MAARSVCRERGEAAWGWVSGHVREDEGPWLLPAVDPEDGRPVDPAEDRDSLYAGIGGLARCWPRSASAGR